MSLTMENDLEKIFLESCITSLLRPGNQLHKIIRMQDRSLQGGDGGQLFDRSPKIWPTLNQKLLIFPCFVTRGPEFWTLPLHLGKKSTFTNLSPPLPQTLATALGCSLFFARRNLFWLGFVPTVLEDL